MIELEGQTFAGYEVISKLGQGGMGAVYLARDPKLDRQVALKILPPNLAGDPDFIERFQREAIAAAKLNHPNIVHVYTAGESDGIRFIAMEFVEGESLHSRLKRKGKLDPSQAIVLTLHVAHALAYAWTKARLIHRDIKPDNIFLSSEGEVKVGDLGLAKVVGADNTGMTRTGVSMGSPHYVSPEQVQGDKEIDFRTDIYSLGCMLYHMLTGHTPYAGESWMAVMAKHIHEPPPAIFKTWPQCPKPLGKLVTTMLAKQRGHRPQTYEQLIAELHQVNEQLDQATGKASPARRLKAALVVGTVIVAALFAAISFLVRVREKVESDSDATARRPEVVEPSRQANNQDKMRTPPAATPAPVSTPTPLVLLTSPVPATTPQVSSPASSIPAMAQATPAVRRTTEAGWIDLLPLIDLPRDTCLGDWTIQSDESLASDSIKNRSVIEIPYQPPEEYDFRVRFTKLVPGSYGDVRQILSKSGRSFFWVMGGFRTDSGGNTICVFDRIGPAAYGEDPSVVKRPSWLETGRPYTATVEVRNGGVKAFLDGDLVTERTTDYSDARIADNRWRWRNKPLLGLAVLQYTVFHSIEVREVTGKGWFTRPTLTPSLVSTSVDITPEDPLLTPVINLPPAAQVATVIAHLKRTNPKFDGKATHKIENNEVTELVLPTSNITNIAAVKLLTKLKKLVITPWIPNQQGALVDLSPLKGLPLTILGCQNNPIRDLSPLKGMPLTVLDCTNTQVSDLTPLEGMPLTVLLCQNTKVTDLSPLQGLPLQEIRCNFVERDYPTLRNIKTLTKINNQASWFMWKQVDAAKPNLLQTKYSYVPAKSMRSFPMGYKQGNFPPSVSGNPIDVFAAKPVYFDHRTGESVQFNVTSPKSLTNLLYTGVAFKNFVIQIHDKNGNEVAKSGPHGGGNIEKTIIVSLPKISEFTVTITDESSTWLLIKSIQLQ